MNKIQLQICGDQWQNRDQILELLPTITADWVVFDTGAEGISLSHSGILDTINQWVKDTNRNPTTVFINNPNTYEKTPYKNLYNPNYGNHFFGMSKSYLTDVPELETQSKLFGLFLGRHTSLREQVLSDVVKNYYTHFVLSVMKTKYPNPWSGELLHIKSIDDLYINDQYTGEVNTNLNLLQFYNQFQIEIVAETMSYGETFFPTEKTLRPITGLRPWLVIGSKNFLSNLRSMGFSTYQSCWSEDYDHYEGTERWNKIQIIIEQIINDGYDIDRARSIARCNFNVLKKWQK